jgi:triacylglycerol lipase
MHHQPPLSRSKNFGLTHRLLLFFCLILLSPAHGYAAGTVRVVEQPAAGDYVVLVHGVQWFRETLQPTAERLHAEGYHTVSVLWPTRSCPTLEAAAQLVRTAVQEHCVDEKKRVHFLGHSMGSIVIRQLLTQGTVPHLGRVVLLAPPNHGTPLARPVRSKILQCLVGRPVKELRPGRKGTVEQLPERLPTPPGIIMGSRSGWFPMLSWFIPGPDDGVVPVASGPLAGMGDFTVLPVSHTRMPAHQLALDQAVCYLHQGRFEPSGGE